MTKSIVITGGSEGIGRAAADALAASGWAVIGVARHTPAGFPGQCITADLSDFERTAEVATELAQRGDILGIVNNVGAAKHERFGSVDPSAFFEVMKGNTQAALQLTQAPVPTMRKARFGRIINITSLVTRGLPFRILGAIVSTIVMMGLAKLLISWDMTPLTAPFVLTAWLLLFALYQFCQLHPTKLIGPMPVHSGAAIQTDLQEAAGGGGAVGLTAANLANALFRGVGEVFLQDNLWTGVVFAIAILVNSRVGFGFALLGSALGGLTALVLGGDGVTIYHGLYGFNAVLTGIALSDLFLMLNWRSTIYALIGAIFSAIVFAAIAVALSPIGMPALTAPFVLTTWVFLLPTAGFRALQRVSVAECASTSSLVRLRTPELTRAE